jgi:hypothetical protein
MACDRRPGPMCPVSSPTNIDAGTLCRAASPRPGPSSTHGESDKKSSSGVGFGVLSEVSLGEFHDGQSTWTGTLINVGVGLIPVVGQVADARDTAAAAKKVWNQPTSGLAWAGLGMAIVGWVPLVGDAVKGGTKVVRKAATKVEIKPAASGLGERMIKEEKRSGQNVDVAAQEHRHMDKYRLGSGEDAESAHLVNSSSLRDIPNYVRDKALTVLLPIKQHRAFDAHWMKWARARRKSANAKPGEEVRVTVKEWENVLNEAIESVPELRGKTAGTMSWMIHIELYQTLGLRPDDLIRVPK